jgi:hypothetical protein
MTNLPAIIMSEAERAALEFARDNLTRRRNADTPWSKDSALSPAASHAMVQHLLLVGWGDVTMRLRSLGRLASESKCLAQSNKSGDGGAATNR